MGPANDAAGGFTPTAVDLRDYVYFQEAGPATRRVFATDVVAVDLTGFEPKQETEVRAFRTADAVYTVLGGRAWVVTDEAEVTLEPLQSLMVPAGVPHAVRNDAPDPLILQIVVSPPDDVPAPPAGPAEPPGAGGREPRASLLDRVRRTLGG
ncbi:MAG TPA: cupin domain-containing protein [Egibacteraceae bacterium]|nr:cupin domain-containing protein [Egibacteraceae bacterium]